MDGRLDSQRLALTLPESLWPIKTCGNACKRNANAINSPPNGPAAMLAHPQRTLRSTGVAAIEQLRSRGGAC